MVITVADEIDLATSAHLRVTLEDALDTVKRAVDLDLAGVKFVGAAGANVLVRNALLTQARNLDFRIIQTSEPVRRVLGLTGLLHLLY